MREACISYSAAARGCYGRRMKKTSQPRPVSRKPQPADDGATHEGTNAVEHKPDPKAHPIPDGEHKYMSRSPFRSGND